MCGLYNLVGYLSATPSSQHRAAPYTILLPPLQMMEDEVFLLLPSEFSQKL